MFDDDDPTKTAEDKIGDAVLELIGCAVAAVLLVGFAVATLVKVWS